MAGKTDFSEDETVGSTLGTTFKKRLGNTVASFIKAERGDTMKKKTHSSETEKLT
jgi:hypothetical protein